MEERTWEVSEDEERTPDSWVAGTMEWVSGE